jgi:hypothetical protein
MGGELDKEYKLTDALLHHWWFMKIWKDYIKDEVRGMEWRLGITAKTEGRLPNCRPNFRNLKRSGTDSHKTKAQ